MTSRIPTDENAPFNHAGGLAAKNAAVGLTRRPALGNLVNRAPKPNAVVAEPLKKSVIVNTENDYHPVLVDLKKVKPRVDTHWTKPVTRSTTLKAAINVKATETSSVLTAAPKLVKTRTTTTASIKEVKYVSSTKTTTAVAKKEKSNSPVRQVSIKREESNLSGKTLTKIRTSAAKLVAAKTANVLKVKVSNSDVAIKKKVQTSVEPKVEAVESNYRPAHSANMLGEFNDINIDANDESNPLLVSEYVNDIYAYLYHMERVYAIEKNHLGGQRDVHPKMRSILMDWINEVHLQYSFVQETFHMAVSVIDRYLQKVKTTSRQNLQLVGVAALFLSSKYEELYPPEISDFVYITDDTYNKHQVIEMERHILKKLKFELGSPLTIHFLRRFSKAAHCEAVTHIMGKYFIELATIDYGLCEYLPSQIAAASLFISLCINKKPMNPVEYVALWCKKLEYYSNYTLANLMPVIRKLAEFIIDAPTSKLNNVYKKYRANKFQEVATSAEKSVNLLENIINMAV